MKKNLDEEEKKNEDAVKKEQEKLEGIKQENRKLKEEIWSMEQKLRTMDEDNKSLRQQTEVSTAVPEKKVVFNGDVANGAHALSFDMKPRIVFPMEGGTALITFEEEEGMKIKLIIFKRSLIFFQSCIILILKMHEETKCKHGGDQVEPDLSLKAPPKQVFTPNIEFAKGLTDKQIHEVEIEKGKKHKVKVTPFLNGSITLLKTCNITCKKTVLLTGIPDIMEQDNLQDQLEIHFQKTNNSGGEVDAIIYNPQGRKTLALFEEDAPKDE
uniref:Interferon-induced protein 35 n=1 Tax=Astyanax mexicanus TaxID=7994 RepID=A0A8B9JFA6_ASTMX